MIFDHAFMQETKKLLVKAHMPGVCYSLHSAAEGYATERHIYHADIRYAMRRCEVIAAEKHLVPGCMRYWVTGSDIDRRSLTMVVVVGDYPIIEVEKLMTM